MEIRQQYLQNYLHDIAIDQLMDDYRAKGYQVSKEAKIGDYQADLVAKKEDEVVVIEVKTGHMSPQRRRQLVTLGDYVRTQKNYKFLVVLASPPKPKRIDIPNLDQLLATYLIDHFPASLYQLSSHTQIAAVSDSTVDEVSVNEDGSILVKGNGIIDAKLNYDSNQDDQTSVSDSFPFTFEIVLKHHPNQELFVADAHTVDIDLSSFYE